MRVTGLVLVCCAVFAGAAAGDGPAVRQLHLFHRHGARTVLVDDNRTVACGALGCGMLTPVGVAMLEAMGRDIRRRYGGLLGDEYHPTRVQTVSTHSTRVIQSAVSLLRGAFGPGHIFGVDASDHLLDAFSHGYDVTRAAGLLPGYTRPPADLDLLSDATLRALALETGQVRSCGEPSRLSAWGRLRCVGAFNDFYECAKANGTLEARYPLVAAHGATIVAIHTAQFAGEYGFDLPAPRERRLLGANLFKLASHISKKLGERAAAGPGPLPPPTDGDGPRTQVYHWSAHDVNLAPFSTSIGAPLMFPKFGDTFAVELLEDASGGGGGGSGWFIRVLLGTPGQTPGTAALPPSWARLAVGCAPNSTDAGLTVRASLCPLDNFRRFVAASGPQSPLGSCYLPPAVATATGCDRVDEPARHELCRRYRSDCPDLCCPAGYSLLQDGLRCVAVQGQPGRLGLSAARAYPTF